MPRRSKVFWHDDEDDTGADELVFPTMCSSTREDETPRKGILLHGGRGSPACGSCHLCYGCPKYTKCGCGRSNRSFLLTNQKRPSTTSSTSSYCFWITKTQRSSQRRRKLPCIMEDDGTYDRPRFVGIFGPDPGAEQPNPPTTRRSGTTVLLVVASEDKSTQERDDFVIMDHDDDPITPIVNPTQKQEGRVEAYQNEMFSHQLDKEVVNNHPYSIRVRRTQQSMSPIPENPLEEEMNEDNNDREVDDDEDYDNKIPTSTIKSNPSKRLYSKFLPLQIQKGTFNIRSPRYRYHHHDHEAVYPAAA